MGLSHRLRDRLASVLLVNAGSSRAQKLLVKRVERYADCRLLHLSCQHVRSACPHHNPRPQHVYVKYKCGRRTTTLRG